MSFDMKKYKEAQDRLEAAECRFNWSTGDAIDPAIEEYNAALAEVEKFNAQIREKKAE